ncbi:hypothetical protein HR11_04930 [Porphyromonas macacae]|uniref:hypothetical protein n=1 Tax=Porphyromonas macacae TaxID=28115 RepID=UPI00052C626B|nr:hypothetical protein [Porphyromonas macacae]KGN99583.1 hypothetical protein HR11_04930 [Porphyromonas macacae]
MKTCLLSFALILSIPFVASAQNDISEWQRIDTVKVVRIDAEKRMATKEETNYIPKTVFVELLGPSGNVGLNFDMRLSKQLNGLGARAGLSFISAGGNSILGIPLGLNYLLGKRGKYFEMGAGASLFVFNSDDKLFFTPDNSNSNNKKDGSRKSKLFGTLTFGYRKQPVKGGFNFRVGISPVYGEIDGKFFFYPLLPYVSFGYTF